jgi:hypothetical protein
MFERHDQNLTFLCFRAIFVSYCPLFWGSVDIYKEYDSLYILERNDKKFIMFAFMAVFVNYWPQFWGSRAIYKVHDTDTSQMYLQFLMLHACSFTICLVFCYTSWCFYAFSGTNLLIRCHSASSLFFAIFVFQKSYTGNILRIGRNKSWTSYFNKASWWSKMRRRGARG